MTSTDVTPAGVPAELTTASDFVQVRLALLQYLGGALEAVVFTRIQYRTQDDSRAWVEHDGRRWWTITIAELAAEMGASDKQIRRVLDILTERGAIVRQHLKENGPYDQRWSYSPVILDVPSRANEAPSGADQSPARANVQAPSGANVLPPQEGQEVREGEPLSPFCSKHPSGTESPCGPCGTARARHARYLADQSARPAPLTLLVDTEMCRQHPDYPIELDGSCTKCTRIAAEIRGAA